MKLTIFKLVFLFGLGIMMHSCLKEHDDIVPDLQGVPAGGMTGLNVTNLSGDIAEIEMTLFAIDHFGDFISGLSNSNFSITDLPSSLEYSILSVKDITDENRGAYSASLLFDQSGSINSTDPANDRIEAGVAFAKLINNGDEAAIAAFSSGGYYTPPYELLSEFSQNQDEISNVILGLAGKADGGTPLYKAIFNLIPYTVSNGNNENKAVVAFTDGDDTDGGVSINQIVEQACKNQVRIYTVGLGIGVDSDVLTEIAFRTGGAVMLAQDAIQLVSLYNSLGDLLRGKGRYYKVKFKLKQGNDWRVGQRVTGKMTLKLSESFTLDFPFNILFTRENAGDLDNRLPTCSCITNSTIGNEAQKWQDKASQYLSRNKDEAIINQPITCAYTDIYYMNPEKFKWAGLAAIVSGKVGEASDDYHYGLFAEFKKDVFRGNQSVFDNLFWQHLAFQEGGIEQITRLFSLGCNIYIYA